MTAVTYITLFITLMITIVLCYAFIIFNRANKLRIRHCAQDKTITTDYLMSEKLDKKSGSKFWVSVPWQKKVRFPEPPGQCIDTDNKGRKIVEAYRLGNDDELYWIRDKGIDLSQKKGDGERVVESYQPFTATSRTVLVSQFRRAEAERKKSMFSAETIVPIAAITSLTILVIMLMIFWGDIAKPALDSHNLALQVQKQNIRIMQELGIDTSGIVDTAEPEESSPLPDDIEGLLPI